MPPRPRLRTIRLGRRPTPPPPRAPYSTDRASAAGHDGPLIRVHNLPAPHTGHVRVLELDRPGARNAISRALLAELRAQVDDVQAQYDADGNEVPTPRRFGGAAGPDRKGPTRALVIASAVDASFCAGADLKERRGFSPDETAAFLASLRATLTSLSALPVPTISAVASLALGGGLELALATHFRVLASTAAVGLPETRLGIIPGAGGTYRLPALVGVPRARDMVLTGRRVGAAEAYFLGVADRLVEVLPAGGQGRRRGDGKEEEEKEEEEGGGEANKKAKDEAVRAELLGRARRDVLSEAVRLAFEICEGGPVAVRAALRAVQAPAEVSENAMYERVVATEDRDEALRAFGEKRKPVFTGR